PSPETIVDENRGTEGLRNDARKGRVRPELVRRAGPTPVPLPVPELDLTLGGEGSGGRAEHHDQTAEVIPAHGSPVKGGGPFDGPASGGSGASSAPTAPALRSRIEMRSPVLPRPWRPVPRTARPLSPRSRAQNTKLPTRRVA